MPATKGVEEKVTALLWVVKHLTFSGDCGRTDFFEKISKCMQLSICSHRTEELLNERSFSCSLFEKEKQLKQVSLCCCCC